MKEAFGGAFMIKLGIVFLIIYVTFMCLAISYARAFRVKNQILNYIEQYEGYDKVPEDDLRLYLQKVGYYVNLSEEDKNGYEGCIYDQGYCVAKKNTSNGNYYVITTFIHIDFPFFGLDFNVPIKGETRIVTNDD